MEMVTGRVTGGAHLADLIAFLYATFFKKDVDLFNFSGYIFIL